MTGELVLNEIRSGSGESRAGLSLVEGGGGPVELSRKLQHKLLRFTQSHFRVRNCYASFLLLLSHRSSGLRGGWKVKAEFLLEGGDEVDYERMGQSPSFLEFQEESGQLASVDLSGLSMAERKAFFLNVYNTLTIHALARQVKREKNVTELDKFWQKAEYRIGGLLYSLDDIEHGVIRCNKLHPTTQEHFFKDGDPRREFVLPTLDPRIHFALNCGAKSCPVIRLFTGDNVDKGLDMATRNFCQNEISIDLEAKRVTLTKILMWYAQDFGVDEKSILQWLLDYLSEEQRDALKSIIDDNPEIEYSDYNWKIA